MNNYLFYFWANIGGVIAAFFRLWYLLILRNGYVYRQTPTDDEYVFQQEVDVYLSSIIFLVLLLQNSNFPKEKVSKKRILKSGISTVVLIGFLFSTGLLNENKIYYLEFFKLFDILGLLFIYGEWPKNLWG